jgi:hypothetical protein
MRVCYKTIKDYKMGKKTLVKSLFIVMAVCLPMLNVIGGKDLKIGNMMEPSVCVLLNGDIGLVCRRKDSYEIFFYKIKAAGMKVLDKIEIANGKSPSITTLDNGNIAVAYNFKKTNELRLRILNSAGDFIREKKYANGALDTKLCKFS